MTLWDLRKKQLNFNNMAIFKKNYKLLLFSGSIFKLTNFKSKQTKQSNYQKSYNSNQNNETVLQIVMKKVPQGWT